MTDKNHLVSAVGEQLHSHLINVEHEGGVDPVQVVNEVVVEDLDLALSLS